MKPDPLNYVTADPLYYDKHFPGVFEPMPECNGARWKVEHPELARILPKAKSMADPNPPRKRKARPAPLPLKPEIAGDVMMIIRMPLPPKELSPNGRAAWQRKAEFTKAARNAVAMQVRSVVTKAWLGCSVRLDVRRWADKRMDSDNCWSALKSHRDGVADGLMTTDAQFELGDIQQIVGKESGGRREVELTITRVA
jgi:hypothetical protein